MLHLRQEAQIGGGYVPGAEGREGRGRLNPQGGVMGWLDPTGERGWTRRQTCWGLGFFRKGLD